MSEERLMILKLLEEGKVTPEQAAMLLEALGDSEPVAEKKEASSQEKGRSIPTAKTPKNSLEDTVEGFEATMESLEEDLEAQFESFGEHFTKKINRLGNEIADKSVYLAEKLVGAFGNLVENSTKSFEMNGRLKSYEEVIERPLPNSESISLSFTGINDKVSIQVWEQDTIQVKAYIRATAKDYEAYQSILIAAEEGNQLSFYPKEVNGISMGLQVKLPKEVYETIKAETVNGPMSIEGLECVSLYCRTKNSPIKLQQLRIEKDLGCTNANGKISLEKVSTGTLLAVTKNSKITLGEVSAQEIELLTSNSKITVENLDYELLKQIKMKTSNASIEISDPIPHRDFEFDLSTSNGKIILSPHVECLHNIRSFTSTKILAQRKVEANGDNEIELKAYTSNSNIILFQ